MYNHEPYFCFLFQSEAKDEVKKVCRLLGSLSGQCSSVVDMFFDDIWQLIVAETVRE